MAGHNRIFVPPSESDIPMHGWSPYHDVHRERVKAHEKHDNGGASMERKNFLNQRWLPVLVEEVGEAAKELCEYHNGVTDMKTLKDRLRKELVQVAAMATAWIDAIDSDTTRMTAEDD